MTSYEAQTKAQLRAEFLARGLDQAWMSDLELSSRTTKDELLSALYTDDYLCAPCWCPACRGSGAFVAGDWESEEAQQWIEHMRRDPEHYADQLWRYDHVARLLEQADRIREWAESDPFIAEHERWLRERARRMRMRDHTNKEQTP